MRFHWIPLIAFVVFAGALAARQPAFEVASIKPNPDGDPTLRALVLRAYSLHESQLIGGRRDQSAAEHHRQQTVRTVDGRGSSPRIDVEPLDADPSWTGNRFRVQEVQKVQEVLFRSFHPRVSACVKTSAGCAPETPKRPFRTKNGTPRTPISLACRWSATTSSA